MKSIRKIFLLFAAFALIAAINVLQLTSVGVVDANARAKYMAGNKEGEDGCVCPVKVGDCYCKIIIVE